MACSDSNGGGGYSHDQETNEENNSLNQENSKKYKVKFNSSTNMVEFIDQKTGNVVETILPHDLINLISKTIKPEGFLIDKKL